jgi:acetate kinase
MAGDTQPPVLVINCGSSSVKYQVLAMGDERAMAGGLFERIGEAGSRLSHWVASPHGEKSESVRELAAENHREALGRIGSALRESGLLAPGERLAAVGHRVVHGGEAFSQPTRIDAAMLDTLRSLTALAPLHNPANILGIEASLAALPDVPQVAVFDTAFHQSMPPHAFRYAVPEAWYRDHGVRRYGFHGTSHRYVAGRASNHLGRPLDSLNLITLHLGNGASVAAIRSGKCVDTSMGLTPLEGLVMGTRCGDLDAAIPLHMQRVAGLTAQAVDHALNHDSGMKGLCGVSDLREVLRREREGDERARLGLEVYGYRIRKYIGAYFAALGSVDAIVFTGGVGENASRIRLFACAGLAGLGIALDEQANEGQIGEVADIGRAGMAVRVLVVRTNEELQIARETLAIVGLHKARDTAL